MRRGLRGKGPDPGLFPGEGGISLGEWSSAKQGQESRRIRCGTVGFRFRPSVDFTTESHHILILYDTPVWEKEGMLMRLDKLLANIGYGSRKEVKKLLKEGFVQVNGETVTDGKTHVDPEKDEIYFGEEKIIYRPFIYLMMNKPKGVLSATEDPGGETVIDLLEEAEAAYRPHPVGRLDKDTVGLLLLTNDGKLTHQLLSPKKRTPKTYYAIVEGTVTEDLVPKFKRGIRLDDGYQTMPAELKILRSGEDFSEVELTIFEGKFHQVKRMFLAVNHRVRYLKRLAVGPIVLDERLREGEYRHLTEEEMGLLKEYVQKQKKIADSD